MTLNKCLDHKSNLEKVPTFIFKKLKKFFQDLLYIFKTYFKLLSFK
jgi:hypothetical protein